MPIFFAVPLAAAVGIAVPASFAPISVSSFAALGIALLKAGDVALTHGPRVANAAVSLNDVRRAVRSWRKDREEDRLRG